MEGFLGSLHELRVTPGKGRTWCGHIPSIFCSLGREMVTRAWERGVDKGRLTHDPKDLARTRGKGGVEVWGHS